MTEPAQEIRVTVEPDIRDIDVEAWDNCAHNSDPDSSANGSFNPFISHAFLSSLEEAGCVKAETGWYPQHIVVEGPDGRIAACAPCYLKGHSQGEYVFDHGWADALERAGGRYYPKLQVSVPFSPVAGPRLLIAPNHDTEIYGNAIAKALKQLTHHLEASSAHLTFLAKKEWDLLGKQEYLKRNDKQFHWFNNGYSSFDDFLSDLSSRKRKNIRRDREKAQSVNMETEWLTGSDINEGHWDAFYRFYIDTGSRKWGTPYLNRTFFSLLGERLSQSVLLIMVKRNGAYIAGALNLFDECAIYGRHWGCIEDHPFLHFETCYYQAIEFAISKGLKRVEAGAQGPHKLARGYVPVTTYSSHYIAHEGLRQAVDHYLRGEREQVEFEGKFLRQHTPFRKDGSIKMIGLDAKDQT